MATREWVLDSVERHVKSFLRLREKGLSETVFAGRAGYLLEDLSYFGEDNSKPPRSIPTRGKNTYFLSRAEEKLYRVAENGTLAELSDELDFNGFPIALREALGV